MPSEDVKKVLKDAYDKIQSLMMQDRWLEAHRACLEVLQFDPDNINVIRLKNKIEKKVKAINRDAIKDDLKNLQPLLNEGKYEEYLSHLKELEPYIGDYPALKDIILKAQSAYQSEVGKKQQIYYKDETAAIKKLAEQEQFQEALQAAETLRRRSINEKELKKVVAKIRFDWVESELKKNKALLESQRYDDIVGFYESLLRIDGSSQKLPKFIRAAKDKAVVNRIEEKRDLIYKELEKMKTLYQLQKYQKTMETAKVILNIDPKNREAKEFYRKARNKSSRERDKELTVQMKSARKQIKEQYRHNKKDFIRI